MYAVDTGQHGCMLGLEARQDPSRPACRLRRVTLTPNVPIAGGVPAGAPTGGSAVSDGTTLSVLPAANNAGAMICAYKLTCVCRGGSSGDKRYELEAVSGRHRPWFACGLTSAGLNDSSWIIAANSGHVVCQGDPRMRPTQQRQRCHGICCQAQASSPCTNNKVTGFI
jgi:hypothetical protein